VATWLLNTTLDIIGAVALYFVLWLPLADRLFAAVPALGSIPFVERGPEIILAASVIITVAENVSKLVKMLTHHDAPASYNIKAS
jgi:hypothetical protein